MNASPQATVSTAVTTGGGECLDVVGPVRPRRTRARRVVTTAFTTPRPWSARAAPDGSAMPVSACASVSFGVIHASCASTGSGSGSHGGRVEHDRAHPPKSRGPPPRRRRPSGSRAGRRTMRACSSAERSASSSCRPTRWFAPPDVTIVFSPFAATVIRAVPVGASGSMWTFVTSTPSASRDVRIVRPFASSPTRPIRIVGAPMRDGGDGLVRALAAGERRGVRGTDRLARTRQRRDVQDEVGVDAAEDDDAHRPLHFGIASATRAGSAAMRSVMACERSFVEQRERGVDVVVEWLRPARVDRAVERTEDRPGRCAEAVRVVALHHLQADPVTGIGREPQRVDHRRDLLVVRAEAELAEPLVDERGSRPPSRTRASTSASASRVRSAKRLRCGTYRSAVRTTSRGSSSAGRDRDRRGDEHRAVDARPAVREGRVAVRKCCGDVRTSHARVAVRVRADQRAAELGPRVEE